jgi:hypothetical protein
LKGNKENKMGKAFKTKDSALAFYVNQLDNLDKRLYMPLTSVTWGRDIKLRSGITMSNESTSFIQSAFAASGSLSQGNGVNSPGVGGSMPWISPEATAIPGISIDGTRVVTPLRLLAREIAYSSPELERSQLLGQPIDAQKMDALNIVYQMNIDQMVYIGDTAVSQTGLLNNSSVTSGSVSGGTWAAAIAAATPNVILQQVNTLVESAWAASGFAVCPTELRVPPAQFAAISSAVVSTAGSVSILKFLEDNSISLRINGKALNIQPLKWLTGRGASGADRMVCYTNEENRVRFPMVPIRRETPYYRGIMFSAPYLWAFGGVEFVYPETVQYADGI